MSVERPHQQIVGRAREPLTWVALGVVLAASTWWWWATPGTSDVELWLAWIQQVMAHGPRDGYVQIRADYPPGAALVLWGVGQLAGAAASDPRVVLKLVLLGFLLATTGLLLTASRRPGLTAFAHAALVLNSFGLMYLDVLTAPFVLGGIWAARAGRVPLMAGLLAGACLMKWQPLFLMPFVVIYVLRTRTATDQMTWRRQTAKAGAIVAGLALLVTLLYGVVPLYGALDRAGHHNDLSSYGANPLWILTWWFEWTAPAGRQSLSMEGLVSIMAASRPMLRVLSLITLVAYGTILRKYWRSPDRTVAGLLRFSLAGYLAYFMFSAGVHENHLFLASLLGIAIAWQEPKQLGAAVALAAAANLNLLAFYGWDGVAVNRLVGGVDVSVVLAVGVSIALTTVVWRLMDPDQPISRSGRR